VVPILGLKNGVSPVAVVGASKVAWELSYNVESVLI